MRESGTGSDRTLPDGRRPVALVTSQQPMIAGERVGVLRWVGLALGAAGAVLVILARSSVDVASSWALAFAVLALACITGGTLWEKRFGTDVHPVTANLVQYTVGLAVTAPLAFAPTKPVSSRGRCCPWTAAAA